MCVRANIEPLAWESEYFQLRSAKLAFSSTAPQLTTADLQPFDIVQAKIPADRLVLADDLANLGFRLVEGEIDLSLPIGLEQIGTRTANNNAGATVFGSRIAVAEDIPWLRAQAEQAFALSRFRAPWYQAGDSARFYAEWVEKAVLGTFDHQCLLVLNTQRKPAGFVTLRALANGEARIGLLAVAPEAAGLGIGKQLMQLAQNWCRDNNLSCLHVATQTGNIPALRLYIRSGAVIESTAYWLYR